MTTLDIVIAGYIVQDDKVLLVHHRQLDEWLPVGGHIDENETPDDALRREAKEELGIEIDFIQYPEPRKGNHRKYALPFFTNVHHITKDHLHYCFFYLCKPKSKEISLNREELYGYGWFTQEDLNTIQPSLNDSVKKTSLEAIKLMRNYI